MANLSNINNILRTSSAGVGINCDAEFSLDIEKASANAILSLNSSGGSGAEYVLSSTTSGEFVLNKRYVGDRLTISSGGNATFSGDITSVGLTVDYTGNRTGDAGILVTNDNSDWGIKVDKDGTDDYGILSQTDGDNAIVVRNAAGTTNIQLQGDGDATFGGDVTATGVYTAGNSAIIYKAQRSGGAVASDWSYDDATTDMSLGTSTAHSFSLKTDNTRALTIDSSQDATFAGSIGLGGATIANSYRIEITAPGGNIIRSTRGTSVFAAYQSNNSDVYLGTTSNNTFKIITNDATAITIGSNKGVELNGYGSGTFTGTTAYTLAVDSNGNIIETTDGGGDITGSGTANAVAKFTAAKAIGDGPITFSGNNSSFTGTITSNGATTVNDGGSLAAYFNGTGSSYTQGAIVIQSSNADTPEARGQGVFMFNQGKDSTWYMGTRYNNADEWQIGRVAGTNLDTAAATTANYFVKIDNAGDTTFAGDIYGNDRLYLGTKMALDVNGTDLYLGSTTSANHNDTVYIRTNDANRVTITDSTTTFSGLIELDESSGAHGFINTDGTNFEIDINRNPVSGAISDSAKGCARIAMRAEDGGAGSRIIWGTAAANNTTATERMRLTKDGYLGLAITNPSQLFHCNGNALISKLGIGAFNAGFDFYNNGTTYLNGATTIDADLTISETNGELNFSSGNGVIQTTTASTSLTFGVNGNEKMRIHSTGDVLIGATDPTSYNSNADDLIIYEGNDFSGMTLAADNDQGSNIYFADPDDDNVGGITYNHTSNYMNFRVNGSEAIRITSDGYVGIGVTNPGGYNSHGRNLVVNSGGNTGISIISGSSSSGSLLFGDGTGGTAAYRGKIEYDHSNDQFEIRTAATVNGLFSSAGTLTVAGDVIAYGSPSDKRLKENIKPIESALDKVSKLQGVTFNWKESGSILELKEDVGFIAQDVQKVMPELVRENKDGMLSMRHQGIAPILLEAIKELKAEIEELKKHSCDCKK